MKRLHETIHTFMVIRVITIEFHVIWPKGSFFSNGRECHPTLLWFTLISFEQQVMFGNDRPKEGSQ